MPFTVGTSYFLPIGANLHICIQYFSHLNYLCPTHQVSLSSRTEVLITGCLFLIGQHRLKPAVKRGEIRQHLKQGTKWPPLMCSHYQKLVGNVKGFSLDITQKKRNQVEDIFVEMVMCLLRLAWKNSIQYWILFLFRGLNAFCFVCEFLYCVGLLLLFCFDKDIFYGINKIVLFKFELLLKVQENLGMSHFIFLNIFQILKQLKDLSQKAFSFSQYKPIINCQR